MMVARATLTALEQSIKVPRAERFQRAGLLEWAKRFLPHYFTLSPSGMHKWLSSQCDESRGSRGCRINCVGPRGGAKSTVVTLAHVTRCAVEAWEPLIWIISETKDQAENQLEHIALELTSNAEIKQAYPEAFGRGTLWRRDKLRLRNGVAIEAFGVGQKLRGRRQRASRPTLIVCDDLQSDAVMTSHNRREKDWTWLTGTVMKAGTKRTNVFNLATALHRDAIGLRVAASPGWVHRVFSAIEKWPEQMGLWYQWAEIYHDRENPNRELDADAFYVAHKAELTAGAELLWPEEEDLLTLMKYRESEGHSAFEREKQSRPINPESCEWPEEYFDDHIWFGDGDLPTKWDARVITLDPSKGRDARRSDYSAFAMLQLTDGVLYVDCDLERRPVSKIVIDGVRLYKAFKPDGFGVESNAFQELLGDRFVSEFAAQSMVVEPYMISNHSPSKIVRIRKLTEWLAQRRIKFKRGSPGALLCVQQMKDFPDPHTHDDGPDAVEMGIRLIGDLLGLGET